MHLAKKRLIHLPVEYQEELDLLALRSRRENKQVWSLEPQSMESLNLKLILFFTTPSNIKPVQKRSKIIKWILDHCKSQK